MIELETPVIRFQTDCEPCEFVGPIRRNNLTALGDWDQHAATADHRANVAKAAKPVVDDNDNEAFR